MMLTFLFLLQHTSLSPDGKLLIIVGDHPEGMVIDANSGKVKPNSCDFHLGWKCKAH
jgi:hypothetical protein